MGSCASCCFHPVDNQDRSDVYTRSVSTKSIAVQHDFVEDKEALYDSADSAMALSTTQRREMGTTLTQIPNLGVAGTKFNGNYEDDNKPSDKMPLNPQAVTKSLQFLPKSKRTPCDVPLTVSIPLGTFDPQEPVFHITTHKNEDGIQEATIHIRTPADPHFKKKSKSKISLREVRSKHESVQVEDDDNRNPRKVKFNLPQGYEDNLGPRMLQIFPKPQQPLGEMKKRGVGVMRPRTITTSLRNAAPNSSRSRSLPRTSSLKLLQNNSPRRTKSSGSSGYKKKDPNPEQFVVALPPENFGPFSSSSKKVKKSSKGRGKKKSLPINLERWRL